MDSYNKYCLNLLTELISIPSESMNEGKAADYVGSVLEQIGMEIEFQRITDTSKNVIGKYKKGNGSKKLLLGGHLDTVKPNDKWTYDPYKMQIEGNRIYGLGACDMKGGLAAQITAIKKIIDEKIEIDGEIIFVGLADEERYSFGAKEFAKKDIKADFAIFAEPHYNDVIIGGTGKVILNISIEGSSGHAARPETGINAINEMSKLIVAIDSIYDKQYNNKEIGSHCILKIENEYEGYSLSIPERCSITMNKQLMYDEDANDIVEFIKEIYHKEKINGKLEINIGSPYYPAYKVSRDDYNLKMTMESIYETLGLRPVLKYNESVSDANIMVKDLKIPTVLFGPLGQNLHKEDEYVDTKSVDNYIKAINNIIKDYFKY